MTEEMLQAMVEDKASAMAKMCLAFAATVRDRARYKSYFPMIAEGPAEIALASRVAELLWRLRRAARAEAQSISVDQLRRDTIVYDRAQTASAPHDVVSEADEASRRAVAREGLTRSLGIYARGEIANETAKRYLETLPVLLAGDAAIEKIMRYEAHLSRLLKHAMHELEALQDRRHGHATPLARVDIN